MVGSIAERGLGSAGRGVRLERGEDFGDLYKMKLQGLPSNGSGAPLLVPGSRVRAALAIVLRGSGPVLSVGGKTDGGAGFLVVAMWLLVSVSASSSTWTKN